MALGTIEAAIEEYRAGRPVIIVDDEERENEGDVCLAASLATPSWINFMATHARGLICVSLTGERLDQLEIPLMVPPPCPTGRVEPAPTSEGTAFCVSVDAACGVKTGISAADRAATVRALVDCRSAPGDFARPGHVFPLRYREGGVVARRGHTEASVDLALAAGLYPGAVICEVMNPDGTMARMGELEAFARCHTLLVVTVAQLCRFRTRRLTPRHPAA